MVEIWIFHSNLQLCSLYRQLVVSYVVYCLNIWLCAYKLSGGNLWIGFISRQMVNENMIENSRLVTLSGNWLIYTYSIYTFDIFIWIMTMLPSQETGWYNLVQIYDHDILRGNWLIHILFWSFAFFIYIFDLITFPGNRLIQIFFSLWPCYS